MEMCLCGPINAKHPSMLWDLTTPKALEENHIGISAKNILQQA